MLASVCTYTIYFTSIIFTSVLQRYICVYKGLGFNSVRFYMNIIVLLKDIFWFLGLCFLKVYISNDYNVTFCLNYLSGIKYVTRYEKTNHIAIFFKTR